MQKLLLNGAIGLQVIVGAITTGVAAGGKNVTIFPSYCIEPCSFDTLVGRSGLPLLALVGFLPPWLPISPA